MPINADDLPAHVRKKLGLPGRARKAKRSRAGTGHAVDCAGRCGCGEPFARYSEFERHAADTGHHRWMIDLPPIPDTGRVDH